MVKKVYFGYNPFNGEYFVNDITGKRNSTDAKKFNDPNSAIAYLERRWGKRSIDLSYSDLEKGVLDTLFKARLKAQIHHN